MSARLGNYSASHFGGSALCAPVYTSYHGLESQVVVGVDEGLKQPSAIHCAGVGKVLAQMHLAGADFAMSRANALSVSGWRPLLAG